ncbi:MAG: DUF1295 domain-containing protein [Gammaproteobacteria bacterium]|nr:DUF1295 domain-containing protein [Gammaproteobacteria bacterium]
MLFMFALFISMGVMLCAWFVYLYTKNPGVVDVFWATAIFCVGLLYVNSVPVAPKLFMPQVLLFLWAMRLSLFLWVTRVAVGKVEMRYQKVRHYSKSKSLSFLYHFLFQAVLAWVIALPFYFMTQVVSFGLLQYVAALLVIMGIIGETVADMTLYRFAKQQTGQVCQVGLWCYSRHPNYFFECLVWFGFSLMGAMSLQSLLSFLSVITLFCIMWFITIPITEQQSVERRGSQYKDYQKHVSCFFPGVRR